MKWLIEYENVLKNGVTIMEVFTYSISVIIISISIVKAVAIYILEYNDVEKAFEDSRFFLGESVSLALSFILAVEILKIFYIKSYKQLIFVVVLTSLKLTVNYFLTKELNQYSNLRTNIHQM
jgi:uncharacterized membrane protein